MNRAELAEILLGAAGAALAAVTVLVALAAIVSWVWFNRTVKRTAAETAQEKAEEKMREFLAESNIRDMLAAEVKKHADGLYSDMDRSPGHNFNDLIPKQEEESRG